MAAPYVPVYVWACVMLSQSSLSPLAALPTLLLTALAGLMRLGMMHARRVLKTYDIWRKGWVEMAMMCA